MALPREEENLRMENQRLRQRVAELEEELQRVKTAFAELLAQVLVTAADPAVEAKVLEQLVGLGEVALPIFLAILEQPRKFEKDILKSPLVESILKSSFVLLSRQMFVDSEFLERLRQLAIEGVQRLQAKEAVPVLERLLPKLKHPTTRVKALSALVHLRAGKEFAEQLIDLLNSRALRSEPKLSAEAIKTLGASGDPSVVPLLLPFLGELQVADGIRLSEEAAKALQQLGAGNLVDAFLRLLRNGDLSALEPLRSYRREIIEALTRALDSPLSEHIFNAAQALKAWNAVEALPKLRAKVRWGRLTLGEKAFKALDETVAHLERIARLPAAARPLEIPTDTLPRPATPQDIATDTLPRPAASPETQPPSKQPKKFSDTS